MIPCLDCLPCCPCTGGFNARQTAGKLADRLELTVHTRQGFADAMEDLCKSLSCTRTQDVTITALRKSLRTGFPQADSECVNAALTKLFGGIAVACPSFNQGLPAFIAALFRNPEFFTGFGDLLACLLGPQEAVRVRATINEMLLQCLAQLMAGTCQTAGCCPQPTPPPAATNCCAGLCPPIGNGNGNTPGPTDGPHFRTVKRCS